MHKLGIRKILDLDGTAKNMRKHSRIKPTGYKEAKPRKSLGKAVRLLFP
jgi:hypothetical protein